MTFRGVLVRIGGIVAVAWAFVVRKGRRRAARAGQRQHAIDGLRRRYVFGSLGRQAFEDGVQKVLGNRKWRRRRRKSKDIA